MLEVRIPDDVWPDDTEGAVSVWLVDDGDPVSTGDVLCEVMVEKSSFEVAAPGAGRVTRLVEAEQPIARGAIIARIDT